MDNYQTAEPSAKLSNLHLLGPEHKTTSKRDDGIY